jgi:hypothetical protein
VGRYFVSRPGGGVLPAEPMEWAVWFERSLHAPFEQGGRVVASTELPGDTLVSTVFLGLDHSHGFGPPQLFETMVFGGKLDDYQRRYSTAAEARDGHAEAVRRATDN